MMWCYLLQPGICSAEQVLLACKKQRKGERIAKSDGVCPVPGLFRWPVPAARDQSLVPFGVFRFSLPRDSQEICVRL